MKSGNSNYLDISDLRKHANKGFNVEDEEVSHSLSVIELANLLFVKSSFCFQNEISLKNRPKIIPDDFLEFL